MLLMCMAGLSQQQRPQLRKRAWVWPRPQNWFCLLIAHAALHFLWKEHFPVTHETFEYLCDCFVVNNKCIAATNGFKLCSLISVNTHMRSKSIVKIQQS